MSEKGKARIFFSPHIQVVDDERREKSKNDGK